jgi:putative hydrolase of the HAD superfamily
MSFVTPTCDVINKKLIISSFANSLLEKKGLLNVSVYPNPTTNEFSFINLEPGIYQVELFDLLETGKIDEAEFVKQIQQKSNVELSHHDIITAWNSILLDFPLRRLQILQQLQLHYSIFLLSNTNEIHEKAFNDLLKTTCGYPNLGVFFDKVYLSHRVGLRKPDPTIFQYVLDENNLDPKETLFIDDSPQHIEAAKSLHIHTIHMKDDMTMEHDIFLPKN